MGNPPPPGKAARRAQAAAAPGPDRLVGRDVPDAERAHVDLSRGLSGTMRILRRRVLLPAGMERWASGVARAPGQVAMPGLACDGVIVLEVERDPADNPQGSIGWWFVEILCALQGVEVGPPEFFALPKPRGGAPFPDGTATVVRITLAERQYAHWLMQLRAPPFPALVLDAAKRTAMLELPFDPPL